MICGKEGEFTGDLKFEVRTYSTDAFFRDTLALLAWDEVSQVLRRWLGHLALAFPQVTFPSNLSLCSGTFRIGVTRLPRWFIAPRGISLLLQPFPLFAWRKHGSPPFKIE